jgi:AGCS family alanine or glycine:cation symporter
MCVTAFIGMSANFFTSTLASLYRGKDSEGILQGGPMYVIREALGKKWYPLSVLFCVCCMIGCLPIFQANQLTQAISDIGLKQMGMAETFIHFAGIEITLQRLLIGVVLMILVSFVIIGGIQRIGNWAGGLVPLMIVFHFVSVVIILFVYRERLPHYLALIFTDAFSPGHYHGDPFLGGALGGIIMLGVRRATFSNEAGIGTAPMAMGASKSTEPVREGLISMLSPFIDTIISCSLTALAILLLLCTFVFAISALFSYSYYGRKALAFLIGEKKSLWYDYFYLATIVVGAVVSMDLVLNIIDIAFALMAIPTMVSAFVLAPKVMKEVNSYLSKMNLKK